MKIIYNSKEVKPNRSSNKEMKKKCSACNSIFSFYQNEGQLLSQYNEVFINIKCPACGYINHVDV